MEKLGSGVEVSMLLHNLNMDNSNYLSERETERDRMSESECMLYISRMCYHK